MQKSSGVILASVMGASIVVGYLIWRKTRKQRSWKEVGFVSDLFIHPIKACRGMSVKSITLKQQGAVLNDCEIGDRTFMIMYGGGRVSLSAFPRAVLIQPTVIGKNHVKLEAPGMTPIEFETPLRGDVKSHKLYDDNIPGIDCGDEVAEWLSLFLKAESPRLLFHSPELPTRKCSKLVNFGRLGVYAKKIDLVYQYASPFNLVSQASIGDLNAKFGNDYSVTVRNFRANMLIEGCEAFDEDGWRRIRIGTTELIFVKHCTRCLVTTVNPETGIRDPAQTTLKTLRKFRLCRAEEKKLYGNAPKFAVDFLPVKEGQISVGDKIYAEI